MATLIARILIGKSPLAPLKKTTIPRLELAVASAYSLNKMLKKVLESAVELSDNEPEVEHEP